MQVRGEMQQRVTGVTGRDILRKPHLRPPEHAADHGNASFRSMLLLTQSGLDSAAGAMTAQLLS